MPTATLCTDEFAALATRECSSLGMPAMPLVMLPHPTSALLGEDARVKAREVVHEIIHILTQDASALAVEYAGKSYPLPKRSFRAKQLAT